LPTEGQRTIWYILGNMMTSQRAAGKERLNLSKNVLRGWNW
jgi:hypothetical protein